MGRVLILPAVALLMAGCAGSSARYVAKDADGGVVSIPADTDVWPSHNRRNAEELIRRHVGPDFEVVREGEVVTGQATNHDQKVQRDKTFNTTNPFLPAEKDTINTTTTTRDLTEYHITYRRRAGGVTPAGGVGLGGGVVPAGGPTAPGGAVKPAGGAAAADPHMPQVGPRP